MKHKRTNISTGSPWEPKIGYSRAVRVGANIHVSGTTFGDAADAYGQTKGALKIIEGALIKAGARLEHVVRTRIYTVDISQWQEIGRAHAEFFGIIRPATTMVEVRKLIGENLLVEIEAEAIVN